MWRWEGVKMRRSEDEKMWRWEDVKMRRCEDKKMWRWEEPFAETLSGKNVNCVEWWLHVLFQLFFLAEVRTRHVHGRIAIQIVHLHAISCSKYVAVQHDPRVCPKPGHILKNIKCWDGYFSSTLRRQWLWDLPLTSGCAGVAAWRHAEAETNCSKICFFTVSLPPTWQDVGCGVRT